MARRFNPRAGGQTKGCAPCTPHSGPRTPTYRDAELKPRPGPGALIPRGPLSRASGLSPSAGTGARQVWPSPAGTKRVAARRRAAGRAGPEGSARSPPRPSRLGSASLRHGGAGRRGAATALGRGPRGLCAAGPRAAGGRMGSRRRWERPSCRGSAPKAGTRRASTPRSAAAARASGAGRRGGGPGGGCVRGHLRSPLG